MGLITRSEAAHRLKIISSHLSCAITAAREGEWENCSNATVEVSDLLDALRPHLAEAAEAFPTPPVGSLKYNPPAPDKTEPGFTRADGTFQPRTGAFGYSGSASTRSRKVDPNGIYAGMNANQRVATRVANASNKPPAPIVFTPPSKKFAPKPIITPSPSMQALPEHLPEIGDFVQWEPNGILLFPRPYQIKSISEDKEWAFFEGTSTGIPYRELKFHSKDGL